MNAPRTFAASALSGAAWLCARAAACLDPNFAGFVRAVAKARRAPRVGSDAAKAETIDRRLQQLSRAVDQSPASIVITDKNGRIDFVNPHFEQITGYTIAEVIGQNPRILKSGEQSSEFYADLWRTISDGREWHGVFRNRKKNGELYWENASISAIRDDRGRITHYIGVKEDITAQKTAELQLLESQAALQLANAQLQVALTRANELAIEADAANRAKSAFLANMSHELRTPLNVIIGVASTLGEGATKDDTAQASALILESGQSLLSLIEEILDYAGLQAGKARLEAKPFALSPVISHCVKSAAEIAKRKDLVVSCRISPAVPSIVIGDARRVQQIILNLLTNAVKYTTRGRVRLTVSAHRDVSTGWRLSFSVADTGSGMSQAEITQLFRPFMRLDANASSTTGTGLGLVISQTLAKSMGGDIVVKSLLGQGSVFHCCIRAGSTGEALTTAGHPQDAAELDIAHSALVSPPTSQPKILLGTRLPLRVLAADDIRTNRETLRRLMKLLGYAPDLVENGHEVIKALQQKTYDAVILDMQMPVLDGIATARALIRLYPDAAKRPKLIALTANALQGDRERCLEAGMDDYLSKPVLPKDIEACFQRLFASAHDKNDLGCRAHAPQSSVWLDSTHLENMVAGMSREASSEMLRALHLNAIDDFQRTRRLIAAACGSADPAALAQDAHGLKGCFATLGWVHIAARCSAVVELCRIGQFKEWATFAAELDRLFALSNRAMEHYLIAQFSGAELDVPIEPGLAPAAVLSNGDKNELDDSAKDALSSSPLPHFSQ